MRAYKLTDRGIIVLRCIASRTQRDATGKLTRYWTPTLDGSGDLIGREIHVLRGSDGAIIKTLIRHGLLEKPPGSWAYCAAITEEGILALERAREAGRWSDER